MTNHAPAPIPLLCDRCRAEGVPGDADFADLGALLDFEPVPRRTARVDGWTPEVQRAFIVALAATGSVRRACAAVGRAPNGVDQLRRAAGNHGFLAAMDEAMALFEQKDAGRLAAGIAAVAGEGSAWSPPPAPWARAASRRPGGSRGPALPAPLPAPEDREAADKVLADLLEALVGKYMAKLDQERRARLEGRIAEADFYVRQISCFEVSMDVMSGDALALMRDFRHRGHDLLHVSETLVSRLLDDARRRHWDAQDEPPRPEPPRHLFVEHDGFSTEPLERFEPGSAADFNAQGRAHDEAYARAAADQVKWEAEARRDHERRSDAAAAHGSGDGLGRPACRAEGEDASDLADPLRDGPSSPP